MSRVVVVMTLAEAEGLLFAAGNSTSDPDFMRSWFPDVKDRQSAYRGYQVLDKAIRSYREKADEPSSD